MPAIVEAPPEEAFSTGVEGPRAQRCFWLDAVTWAGALQRLRDEVSVYRGVLYLDVDGTPFDSFLICRHIDCIVKGPRGPEQPGLWYAKAQYAYPSVTRQRPQSVVGGPPVYWNEYAEVSEPAEFDSLGRRITNAADEFPNPLPTVVVTRETLVIEWHEVAADRFALQQQKRFWMNRTNESVYLGYPAQSLRCMPVQIEEVNVPPLAINSKLFRLQARLEYRPPIETRDAGGNVVDTYPGWYLVYPNAGTRVRTNNPTKPHRRLMEEAEDGGQLVPVTQNVMLLPDGTARAPLDAPLNYIERRPYKPVDFAGLVNP